MLMEGTGKYFWLLFLVFFVVYVAVKISLGFLLKRAKEKAWKAYVPVYTTYVLTDLLNLNKKYFYFSLIPVVNLYYLYIIIQELLKGFNEDPKAAVWYVIFPMYNFPKLVFKKPKFILNEYDLTEEFLETQNILFEESKGVREVNTTSDGEGTKTEMKVEVQPPTVDNDSSLGLVEDTVTGDYNHIEPVNYGVDKAEDSVFTNEALEPDETHMTYVKAPTEEPKEEKPIITPVVTGRPKMCPNCGAKLAPDATICFLCGTKL